MWKIGRRSVRGNTFVPACVNLFQYREEITKWSQRCYTCSCQVASDGLRRIVQVSLSNLVTLEFNLSLNYSLWLNYVSENFYYEFCRSDFEHEARILTSLNDPNLVRVLGVCFEGDPACMICEYTEEGDLYQFLQDHVAETSLSKSPGVPTLR